MRNALQKYLLSIIQGTRQGVLPSLLKFVLYLFSIGYGSIVSVRNYCYEINFFKQYRPPAFTISVGNLTAGGTGKTPLTIKIVQAFSPYASITVLSRGYKAPAEHLKSPLILNIGNGPIYPAKHAGDEPYLLAKNLPETCVIVGKNRVKSAKVACEKGAKMIILDDALQHRQLYRDQDVVVVDAQNPFGRGYLLPRGLLREPISGLKRAQLIVINHVMNKEQYCSVQKQIQRYTNAPTVGMKMTFQAMKNANHHMVPEISGNSVGIFCGIANPQYFQQTVESLGFNIASVLFANDHDAFSDEELRQFAQECLQKGAKYLLCTEKDFVKLNPNLLLPLPILWPKMQLDVVEDEHNWDAFIKQVLERIKSFSIN